MEDLGIGLWAWLDHGFVLYGHSKDNGHWHKGHGFLRALHMCRFWAFMIAKADQNTTNYGILLPDPNAFASSLRLDLEISADNGHLCWSSCMLFQNDDRKAGPTLAAARMCPELRSDLRS